MGPLRDAQRPSGRDTFRTGLKSSAGYAADGSGRTVREKIIILYIDSFLPSKEGQIERHSSRRTADER